MIAGLLLAAGGATRFGSQKLVAPLDGVPLVRHAADVLARETDVVFVVVGSDAEGVRSALDGLDVFFVDNRGWADGLAGSLRRGLSALGPEIEAVVVALGDQPGIRTSVIRDVVDAWRARGLPVVAARYDGVRGHPVLFERSLFGELAGVVGDVGAKAVIERAPERVAYIDVAEPMPRDVDTRADLDVLRSGDMV